MACGKKGCCASAKRSIPEVDSNALEMYLKSMDYIVVHRPFMVKSINRTLGMLAKDILGFCLRPKPEVKSTPIVSMLDSKKSKKSSSEPSKSKKEATVSSSESSQETTKKRKKSSKPTKQAIVSSSESSQESSKPTESSTTKSELSSEATESDDKSESSSNSLELPSNIKKDKVCSFTLCGPPLKFDKEHIARNRKELMKSLVDKYGKYPKMEHSTIPKLMQKMYEYYDESFFQGLLSRQVKSSGKGIVFELSNQASSSAGSAWVRRNKTTRIMFSVKVFREVTKKTVASLTVNGLNVTNRVDAMMRVMEHELVHLALLTSGSKEHTNEGHGPFFKAIVFALFGHITTTHDLKIDENLVGKTRLTKETVKVGDYVAMSDTDKCGDRKVILAKVTGKNIKTATVQTTEDAYRVRYGELFKPDTISKQDMKLLDTKAKELEKHVNQFDIGDKVTFNTSGKSYTGKIVKLNAKSASLKVEGLVKPWPIPYSFLHKV